MENDFFYKHHAMQKPKNMAESQTNERLPTTVRWHNLAGLQPQFLLNISGPFAPNKPHHTCLKDCVKYHHEFLFLELWQLYKGLNLGKIIYIYILYIRVNPFDL